MKLTFLGATRTVTGSKYLIEAEGKKILVDCGLFQGYKELRLRNWSNFPVSPAEIDAVILTHAHLDHSGYLPLLVKQGFKGKIYCTPPTFDLCKLLLPDSGYIQEEDAARANKYRYSKHDPALPLYTLADAEESLKYFRTVPFGKDCDLGDGIRFRFERNGHILGASWVLLAAERRTILFSGDIGRPQDPVMKAPVAPVNADYVVVEATYGNRRHEQTDPLDQLEAVIRCTAARGGTVIVPAFAIGRAQSLMYYLHVLKSTGRIPDISIYLDSPMAIGAADILEKHMNEHRLSRELCNAVTSSITYVHTPQESAKLDQNRFPKVIIAASGMATGGRVLHHIKHLAPDRENTVLFTGFQAGGTRGDRMLRGEKEVKIHGHMVPINAEIDMLDNMSAHADYEEILDWLSSMRTPPIKTFITHGEVSAAEAMATHIKQRLGWECAIPDYLEVVEL
jgi:metallo-beta-lactamase family protein